MLGPPGLHRFRALGSLQFFLEHSLEITVRVIGSCPLGESWLHVQRTLIGRAIIKCQWQGNFSPILLKKWKKNRTKRIPQLLDSRLLEKDKITFSFFYGLAYVWQGQEHTVRERTCWSQVILISKNQQPQFQNIIVFRYSVKYPSFF